MSQVNGTISNPNLKPERITNYELGFQQALNKDKTAAISISAYYKETRDLIQLVQYAGADPNQNYYSYDNLDFKTIKGFSLSFDMRQSNNVRINANYTLQYAEGTGLTSTTMSELIKEGYTTLKMLNPIADDRRHEFKANVDYRLGPRERSEDYTVSVRIKMVILGKKDDLSVPEFWCQLPRCRTVRPSLHKTVQQHSADYRRKLSWCSSALGLLLQCCRRQELADRNQTRET